MSKVVDLSGLTFGQLTPLRVAGKVGRDTTWLCKCTCGREKVVSRHNLRKGSTKSCGCLGQANKAATIERQCALMIGQKFNWLLVVGRAGETSSGKPIWRCTCECGAEINVVQGNLKSGSTKSCGCYKKTFLQAGRIAELNRKRANQQDSPDKPQNPKKAWTAKQPKEPRPPRRKFTEEELRERRRVSVRRRMAERYANPLIRSHMLISQRMRKSLKRVGATLNGRTFKQLGFSDLELAKHLERQFLPGMSWENMGDWHIDHIIPISTAQTKEDVIRLNQLSNLRPLWKRDNLVKSAKIQFLI